MCLSRREETVASAVLKKPSWTVCDNGELIKVPKLTSLAIQGCADLNGFNANRGKYVTLDDFDIDHEVYGLECSFDEVAS